MSPTGLDVNDEKLCFNDAFFKGHRFPPEIIEYAVWLYFRFSLSLRDVEDLLAERGIHATRPE